MVGTMVDDADCENTFQGLYFHSPSLTKKDFSLENIRLESIKTGIHKPNQSVN